MNGSQKDSKDYIEIIINKAKELYGDDWMDKIVERSGFKKNTINRIVSYKYTVKLDDFITLCNTVDLTINLGNNLKYSFKTEDQCTSDPAASYCKNNS